ncbi:hypothetical protein O5D80_008276 [Batrachochytrium dendrobatidis]|nr:hypothetical protein O5D80_008276 [Batrachochytrium dendrobatidis]
MEVLIWCLPYSTSCTPLNTVMNEFKANLVWIIFTRIFAIQFFATQHITLDYMMNRKETFTMSFPEPPRAHTELAHNLLVTERVQSAVQASHSAVLSPDLSPFTSPSDALQRLVPYHILRHPTINETVQKPTNSPRMQSCLT